MVATDLRQRARDAARAREAMLDNVEPNSTVQEVIAESWQRVRAARADPERVYPRPVERADIRKIRAEHPLAAVYPQLSHTLIRKSPQAEQFMVITDATGLAMWCDGERGVLSRAADEGLVEGSRWGEESTGTNAMGTALAVRGAVEVYSTEHLEPAFDRWFCVGNVVHDPNTGEVIGAVDLTGLLRAFNHDKRQIVTAAVRLAEHELKAHLHVRTRNSSSATGNGSTANREPCSLSLAGSSLGIAPGRHLNGWRSRRRVNWLHSALPATACCCRSAAKAISCGRAARMFVHHPN